jgi:GTP cyclohydrolase I
MKAAPSVQSITYEDVQSGPDTRHVAIDEVGIEDLAYPVHVRGKDGRQQRTVARVAMTAELAEHLRGVHMSRFVEVLHANAEEVSLASLPAIAAQIRERLGSASARLELQFSYFLERFAPASQMASLMEYECRLAAVSNGERSQISVEVRVPVTSLCPCSKEVSDYGAHNQRGYVEIEATSPWPAGDAAGLWMEDLIEVAEAAGSSPVYPLLKRSDEREVTMRAYDNPAFVEDIVRDVAVTLRDDVRVASFRVRATNQESIHNHNAVAQLHWERGRGE